MSVSDEAIVAAREAIYRRQRSLVAYITKASIRDALEAAYPLLVANITALEHENASMVTDIAEAWRETAQARKPVAEALESLDLLCRAEDTHGDTIRAHEVRSAVADLRAALADPKA